MNKTAETLSAKVPELRWDHTPQEINQITNDMIRESDERIKAIVEIKDKRTFENTMIPLTKFEYW